MPELEINNFLGIYRSMVKPPKNAANECRDFDVRGVSGALEQRWGYSKAFDNKPNGTGLSALSYHNAEAFYIPGVGLGQEITVQVGVGTLTSLRITLGSVTDVIPLVWASHVWDGSAWQSRTHTSYNWDWLNETIITRLFGVDPGTLGNTHWIITDINAATFDESTIKGWYVENYNEGGVFRIVDTSYWNDGTYDRVVLKLDGIPNWNPAGSGRLYIMKNYIPIVNLQAMGTAVRNDITFIKVRDEIRIAFGAIKNRIALAVSYQKSYLNIKSFDVQAYSTPLIDAYCATDGLIVCPYSLLNEQIRGDLVPQGSGSLAVDTYYGKITGNLFAGDEILILDTIKTKITVIQNIAFNAYILAPTINRKLKSLKFYYSSNTLLEVFYFFGEINIQGDVREPSFVVNNDGEIGIVTSSLQIHDPNTLNAAAPVTTGDPLAVAGWSVSLGGLSAVADTGAGSINALRLALGVGYVTKTIWYGTSNLKADTWYDYSIYLKRQTGTYIDKLYMFFLGGRYPNYEYGIGDTIFFTGSWVLYSGKIKTPAVGSGTLYLQFSRSTGGHVTVAEEIRIDRLAIVEANENLISDTTEPGAEMSAEMGYTPSRNLIKSWDAGLVTAGRTFVTNVFIEKKYSNKVFFSPIGGDGNVMYDVLTAGNYYDVENFDGNDVRKIELLSNADFLLLQSLASQRLDPDTGRTANIGLNSGTVQPFASVNLGDKVIFPSKYDILMTTGVNVVDISKDTIRGDYRDLSDAEILNMHATKDLLGSAYVLYSGRSSTKTEYILTDKGWIERRLPIAPQRYLTTRQGELRFLSSGDIFAIDKDADGDMTAAIVSLWKSIVFDAETLGEGIPSDTRFVLREFFVQFITNAVLTFNLYLHDKIVPVTADTQVIPKTVTYGLYTYRRPLKKEAVCSRFQMGLSCSGQGGPSECSIYSVGVLYDIIKTKTHA